MGRDQVLGERIEWSARPRVIEAPISFRVAAAVLFALSAVALCFAVVISFSLHETPAEPLLFAAWAAVAGVLAVQAPKIWLEKVEYIVTERHVVMQRGPFRRTIERRAISFARIHWSKSQPGTGDIDLVRAVPTGALKRRLLLQLRGVAAPDHVWAIIRGVETHASVHRGDRPLAQRLDEGEHVVWSARPTRTAVSFAPRSLREAGVLALSLFLFVAVGRMTTRFVPNAHALVQAGLPDVPLAALIAGEVIVVALVLSLAVYFAANALLLPARNLRLTRYLITNRRVLIQRGREELHLDRERIVDVIPSRTSGGLTDVFLVLDGPRARALSIGGAFGESTGVELTPMLESVLDAESVSRILLTRGGGPTRQAA